MPPSLRLLFPRSAKPPLPAGETLAIRRCFLAPACRRQSTVTTSSAGLRAPDADNPSLSSIDASALQITRTTTPRDITPNEELLFGHTFTDHMLSLEWTAKHGWHPPRITPYQNLSLDPATCVLHYAFEAFEGMKAYKDRQGNVRLFRPDKNMARLNRSGARIALPMFDGEKMLELLKKFCQIEERFIPS